MNGKGQRIAVAAAICAAVLAAAGAAFAALGGHGAAATTVRVTEREYRITLSKTRLDAGKVVFRIHNAGKLSHAFAVSGGGMMHVVRTALIAPGKTTTLDVTLAGGTVHVWCPVKGHAALGMRTTFTVVGAHAPAPTPATTTSGGGSAWG